MRDSFTNQSLFLWLRRTGSETGNVLFLILIGVVLFAALSIAIMQSTRSNDGASKEQDRIFLARVDSYTAALRNALTRMSSNGISYSEFNLNNNIYKYFDGTTYLQNPGGTAISDPTDPTDYVFYPGGGGVSPITFTDVAASCSICWAGVAAVGHVRFGWGGIPNIGTSTEPELLMIIYDVPRNACVAYNEKRGIPVIERVTPVLGSSASIPDGSAIWGPSSPGNLAYYVGKDSFCINTPPAAPDQRLAIVVSIYDR